MSRMIIDNRSDLSDAVALEMCQHVINGGRVSNGGKQYGYVTMFTVEGKRYAVSTDLNKASDRFVVSEYGGVA